LFHLALFWLEHAFEGQLQVVRDLVDHIVPANLHARFFGQNSCLFVRHHVETDNDRIRGMGQRDVRFRDAADAPLQQLNLHFRMFELRKLLLDRFDRAANVRPQDNV